MSRQRVCRKAGKNRRGAIVVLAAILMIVMVAFVAFSVDIGYILSARTDIQRATDSGAMAAAGRLGDGIDLAEQTAIEYVQYNKVATDYIPASDINVEFGDWDEEALAFVPAQGTPSAVKVLTQQRNQPLFFARALGRDRFDVTAEAIATYRPRDIMVVLDYSGSMNDDSELKHIGRLGRRAIEDNLRQIYTELGSPTFGNMQWNPVYISSNNTSVIRRRLGLDRVPYPYPQGSWNDYINYVRGSRTIRNAGYRKEYGYLTLVNYWLERQPSHHQTPDLWKTSEQPVTAVKDAFAVFLSYMEEVDTDDRIGLDIYTSADGTSTLESPLTDDYALVESMARRRQAAHYDRFTNISAGMEKARVELEDNGRAGALRLMILMTDGKANRPFSESTARARVIQEANKAADAKIAVVTISLGADADTALMQQVADITGGVHFNIPGGRSVDAYEDDLEKVFREIADDRPLKLVK